jgi:hypothetical protein
MREANHVAAVLYSRFTAECKRLKANQKEMSKLAEAYFAYRDLLHKQEEIRTRILKIFGVLGQHSPSVPDPKFAKLISPKPITTEDIRKELKLWEILELYLEALDDGATVSDFKNFLHLVDLPTTPQAIESAIKAHPELFQEKQSEGRGKVLVLRKDSAALVSIS